MPRRTEGASDLARKGADLFLHALRTCLPYDLLTRLFLGSSLDIDHHDACQDRVSEFREFDYNRLFGSGLQSDTADTG
jgi:hypothetical protein